MGAVAIAGHALSVAFGETRALSDVSVDIEAASWTGIVGENGAGKSTLLGVLAGRLRPDRGRVTLAGHEVEFDSTRMASEAGVFLFSQTAPTVPQMTVYENVFMGYHDRFTRRGRLSHARMRQRAQPHIDAVLGAGIDLNAPIAELPYASRQFFQLARVLACAELLEVAAPILLVDEATAALDTGQSDRLFAILEALGQRGATIVYVTHRLRELVGRADRIVVMRDGKIAGELDRGEATEERLHGLMVGRAGWESYYREDLRSEPSARPALEVKGLRAAAGSVSVSEVALTLNQGEVLGLAGVDGSGKELVAQVIAGDRRADRGAIVTALATVQADGVSPARALASGIGYLPSDRLGQSVIADQTVMFNTGLLLRGAGRPVGWIRDFLPLTNRRQRTRIQGAAESLSVASKSSSARVGTLSGGNQQKVAMAKWTLAEVDVLVAVDVTQGVDISARQDCYRAIREMCAADKAVLLVSSDLPELLGMADRVLVMKRGRVVGSVHRHERQVFTEEGIVRMMVG